MTPREDETEATEDEDEFYYSLGRRSAEKQDAPFGGWAAVVLLGALSFIPLAIIAIFINPALGLIPLILFLLFIFFVPGVLVVLLLLGVLTFSSLIQTIRELFKLK